MRKRGLAAGVIATSMLFAPSTDAAFHTAFTARDIDGRWRFDAVDVASSPLEFDPLECRLSLRSVNRRRAVADAAQCFDRVSGWHESELFSSEVDFFVKSDGTVEIHFEDEDYLQGRMTRDRRLVKGGGVLDESKVVWTMTRA